MRLQRRSAAGLILTSALALLIAAACGGSGGDAAASADETTLTLGGRVYQQNCAACHGANGEGQGNWRSRRPDGTYPAPPHDASGHTWHHPDEVLLDIIRRGGQAAYGDASFRSGMPAWADQLSEDEIRAVLAYIKTLWGDDERDYQAALSSR